MQTAITLYTLVMAAFMLLGAKLGDIMGRNSVFAIGLAIYGVGSLTTALSPNLAVLLVGWSAVEGFGAVLVIPAIAALTAATYEGKARALAYALLGGVAANASSVAVHFAQVDPPRDVGLRPVRDGAGHERHERGDLADRR